MNTQKTSISYRSLDSEAIAELLIESMASIQAFASESGYLTSGQFPDIGTLSAWLWDTSQAQDKRLVKWHFRLERKLSMRTANRFLHVLCKKLLEYDSEQQVPRIDYSEKETAIKASRAAWVKARNEAEAFRLAYVEEKGDFYKR